MKSPVPHLPPVLSSVFLSLTLPLAVALVGLACQEEDSAESMVSLSDATSIDEETQKPDVYATVNDRPITRHQVDHRVQRLTQLEQRRDRPTQRAQAQYRQRVLQRLIDRELLRDHIASTDIEICQETLERTFDQRIQSQFSSEQAFQTYLDNEGKTADDVRHEIRDDLAIEALVQKSLDPDEIDEQTLRDHYRRLASHHPAPARVHVDRLRIQDDAADLADLLGDLQDELEDSQRAKQILSTHLDPEHMELRTGDWLQSRQLPRHLAFFLFQDSAIETNPHLHIFPGGVELYWARDHRPPGPRHFDEVEDRLRKRVHRTKVEHFRSQLLDDLRREASITVHLPDEGDAP